MADIIRLSGVPFQAALLPDYIRHFISCGAMGMVKRWLAEGMPLSKAEMMDLTEKIMHPIFQLLFVA